MPGFKAHLFGGALFFVLALGAVLWLGLYRPGPETVLLLAVIALLAALFPDVDTDSKGRVLFYGILLTVSLALMIQGDFRLAAILGFCALLPNIAHHRAWDPPLVGDAARSNADPGLAGGIRGTPPAGRAAVLCGSSARLSLPSRAGQEILTSRGVLQGRTARPNG